MPTMRWCVLVLAAGCSSTGSGEGKNTALTVPRVYPPIRASTPTALVADPAYAAPVSTTTSALRLASADVVSLGMVVQERIYSAGPTELLRIVHEVDDRMAGLDLRPDQHECLTGTPVAVTFSLPAGQSFSARLQCLQSDAKGWLAFGFDDAQPAPGDPDAGAVSVAGGSGNFYLAEGQPGGNGGVYRIDRATGDVTGWIAVAEMSLPQNSQVIMHLATRSATHTLELAFGGTAVGFCGAHLQTGSDLVFIEGKTNAPPPPGSPMGHYCDALRSGCFAASALGSELGAGSCASIDGTTFVLAPTLDASDGGNVAASSIWRSFSSAPPGVPAF